MQRDQAYPNLTGGLFNQSERHVKLIANGFGIVINSSRRITNGTEAVLVLQISSQQKGAISFAMARNEEGRLVACAFSEDGEAQAVKGVMNSIPENLRENCRTASPGDGEFERLHELYMGKGNGNPISIDLSWISPFRKKVYHLLKQIPRGSVTTYGALAEKIGSRKYSRAVGTAVGSNPLPLIIPCHRVVTGSLEVVNYGMPGRKPSEGVNVKKGLLEREHVKFHDGRVSRESLCLP